VRLERPCRSNVHLCAVGPETTLETTNAVHRSDAARPPGASRRMALLKSSVRSRVGDVLATDPYGGGWVRGADSLDLVPSTFDRTVLGISRDALLLHVDLLLGRNASFARRSRHPRLAPR
jgi:hypothetical protein